MKSTPNSFVGVLAVDKSVLLQKMGNDIDKSRVFANLLSFDPSESYEPLKIRGAESKYQDFGGLNSFILTDAYGLDEVQVDLRINFNDEIDSEEYEDFFDENWGKFETVEAFDSSQIRVRKNFPETWIFQTFNVDQNGQFLLRKRVPDTITSFVVTGFSLDKEHGLGISEPQTLTVKQNFFMKLNLPYSIRWGEVLKVEVSVFNYVPDRKVNLSVDVELFTNEADPNFEFMDKSSSCKYVETLNNSRRNFLTVAQNSMSTTYFFIKPLKSGKIKLNVKAVGQQVKLVDAVEKELIVEHEGITHYGNQPVMINLDTGDFDIHKYSFDLPSETIPKSTKVGVSVAGDLLGPALLEISNLM